MKAVLLVKGAYRNQILVRIHPQNVRQVLAGLARRWDRIVPDDAFQYAFLDDTFAASYRVEERLGTILGAFSAVTVVIACLGVFVLATYTVEQRTRELGVRKALGASAAAIMLLISKWLTVFYHALRAASVNPVVALRSE